MQERGERWTELGLGLRGGQASTFDPGVLRPHLVHLLDFPPHLSALIPRCCCLVLSIKPFPIHSIKAGFTFFPKGPQDSPIRLGVVAGGSRLVRPRPPRHLPGGCCLMPQVGPSPVLVSHGDL